MTISIVIPTYNGEKYVEQAIKSALAQTKPAAEIIVSDDNSTDRTLDICKSYSDKIKIFTNSKGPSAIVNGWNTAISHATSDFITILHQDDLLDPTFLEEINRAYHAHPDVKHFFTPCRYIDENGDIIEKKHDNCSGIIYRYTGQEYANAYILSSPHIHRCPGVITHRDIFKKCCYRVEAGHIADDDFFMRVGMHTDIVGVLKPLAFYREHRNSETGHLSEIAINKRLLSDHYFQITNADKNSLFSDKIDCHFRKCEIEYLHRVFLFSLKALNFDGLRFSLSYWLQVLKRDKAHYVTREIMMCKQKIKNILKNHILAQSQKRSAKLNEFKPNGSVLILAPHPDDEVFGCGGMIARLTAEEKRPHVVVMTGGGASHGECCDIVASDVIAARRKLTIKAAKKLGLTSEYIHFLDFEDGLIGNCPESEVLKLRDLIDILKPDTVFIPHQGEGWPDHLAVREFGLNLVPESTAIFEYCVWMWYYRQKHLDWSKASKLEMTHEEYSKKLSAITTYTAACAPCGKPWVGVLPDLFIKANTSETELYFKIK